MPGTPSVVPDLGRANASSGRHEDRYRWSVTAATGRVSLLLAEKMKDNASEGSEATRLTHHGTDRKTGLSKGQRMQSLEGTQRV